MESVETGRLGGLARASSSSPTGRPLPFSSETRSVFGEGISWLVGGDLPRADKQGPSQMPIDHQTDLPADGRPAAVPEPVAIAEGSSRRSGAAESG